MQLSVKMTKKFSRAVALIWDEDDLREFAQWLVDNPTSGALISGSGGVRKTRWSRDGMGKRGGVRVIYFVKGEDNVIWLLHAYTKSDQDTISPKVARMLKEAIDG